LQPRSLTTAEHRVLGYKRGVAFIAKRLRGTGLAKIGVASMRRQPSLTPDFVPSVTLNIEVEEAAPGKRPRSVLLLEDRADFRSILREYLLSCSYQVTSVRSGVEGLREIMKRPFDLIICDMMMPRMGGEMFYWAVTRIRFAARQRFIFFTGHKNHPAIEFFFRRVKATVLYKPFKLAALDAAIRDVFRKLG
jgi:CheY-like chemotaxis protein